LEIFCILNLQYLAPNIDQSEDLIVKGRLPPVACIIGAGPYGLAIAAHLQFAGVNFRIFGSPMQRWLSQMPKNMLLKSEGCASSLPDPAGRHSLAHYCQNEGVSFSEYGTPISREIFAKYALAFQQELVPNIEDVFVSSVSIVHDGFCLRLTSGETLKTTRVIVATGMDYMAQSPEQLGRLPTGLWSHSADHYDLSKFKGKDIAVLGGGQSGLEAAAILREEGASVTLIVRAPSIAWNRIPSMVRRPLYRRLRRPRTRLGEGLQLWVFDNAPALFHYLPRQVRLSQVKASLGPAGAWWLKERVVDQMPIFIGHHLLAAWEQGGRVSLQIAERTEQPRVLTYDHVIAATGYQFNYENLPFLEKQLKLQIAHEERMPKLSPYFESSIPGLYFTGLASANSFGPSMRFIVGAAHTARRIATHISRITHSPLGSFAPPSRCLEN
jgi:cation diffusion facilitator CzcD-associated flavoprotein CzcO